jgi:hypothetical protein
MNPNTNFTPETFDLTKLSLKIPGYNFKINSGTVTDEIDIIQTSVELSMFEHISMPYLTGKLVLVDDFGLLDFPGIKGSEKIVIEFGYPASYIKNITKTFIIRSIASAETYNDFTNVFVFDLIEDIGYYDKVQKISKGYTGTGEQIIQSILQDNLGIELDTNFSKPSHQSAFKYVVPYLSPMQACLTVLSKMTTTTGCPYFLYSSLYSDKLILADLESILTRQSFNESLPFVYSQGQTNAPLNNFAAISSALKSYSGSALEDTLSLVEQGAGGILHNYVVLGDESKDDTRHYSIVNSVITMLENNNIIDEKEFTKLIDENFIVDPSGATEKTLGEMNSKIISTISTSNYPLTPVNSFNQESTYFEAVLPEFRNALLLYLTKNIYNLEMPGFLFLPKTNSSENVLLSVGNQLSVTILGESPSSLNTIVKKSTTNSGRHVMLAKRHILDIPERTHNISIQCARISRPNFIKG